MHWIPLFATYKQRPQHKKYTKKNQNPSEQGKVFIEWTLWADGYRCIQIGDATPFVINESNILSLNIRGIPYIRILNRMITTNESEEKTFCVNNYYQIGHFIDQQRDIYTDTLPLKKRERLLTMCQYLANATHNSIHMCMAKSIKSHRTNIARMWHGIFYVIGVVSSKKRNLILIEYICSLLFFLSVSRFRISQIKYTILFYILRSQFTIHNSTTTK